MGYEMKMSDSKGFGMCGINMCQVAHIASIPMTILNETAVGVKLFGEDPVAETENRK